MEEQKNTWSDIRLPAKEDRLWELYHENSKNTPFSMSNREEPKGGVSPFREEAILPVQTSFSLELDLPGTGKVLTGDSGHLLSWPAFCMLLIKGSGRQAELMGSWRKSTPSGHLMPLEFYFFSIDIQQLEPGLYHFDRVDHCVQRMHAAPMPAPLARYLEDRPAGTALFVFITALFERVCRTYGERGYRLALTEAGWVARNFFLAAQELDLNAVILEDYYDWEIERFLSIDGVEHSLLEIIAIG